MQGIACFSRAGVVLEEELKGCVDSFAMETQKTGDFVPAG